MDDVDGSTGAARRLQRDEDAGSLERMLARWTSSPYLPARVFVARWDLDKTYLRTDFDTVGDLLRTAFERPDQKRTVPGAAALMRELSDHGVEVHILSGSPEQLRRRVVEKLELDGVRFASLTLKPNVQNILRLRFRAVRGQLGYKLPALLRRRCELPTQTDATGHVIQEVLLGDDAEADAFVYSLYADVCSGDVRGDRLGALMRAGHCYEDDVADTVRMASYLPTSPTVERILIHLDQQSSPSNFDHFGPRVVPFFNYLQAAFVLYEDGRLSARAVLRIALEMASRHHFEGSALARSYLELARRGHVDGRGLGGLVAEYEGFQEGRQAIAASELSSMVAELAASARELAASVPPTPRVIDYEALVSNHNPRRHKKRR